MHRIESHCVELNRNQITLHSNMGESYHIASVAALYVNEAALIYRIIGYALNCISYWPQIWRCTSLMHTARVT